MDRLVETFGKMLRRYRRNSNDPEFGGSLTQVRLADLMSRMAGPRAGYSDATISKWERDETPIHKDDRHVLLTLVTVLVQCGGLGDLAEADAWLQAGRYSALDEGERAAVLSAAPGAQRSRPGQGDSTGPRGGRAAMTWPIDIPNETYHRLVGRESDLKDLLDRLERLDGPPIIAIDGLGGLGKTALAVELARRATQKGVWEGVVGASAKRQIFAGGEVIALDETTLGFETLLDAIARQFERWDLMTAPLAVKQSQVACLLRERQLIVLVDNLEAAENANALVVQLRPLLGRSRAVLTSRSRLPHDFVYSRSLRGLNYADAIAFIRAEASAREAPQILAASDAKLAEIHNLTGGAPLALRLVVGQTRHLDLDAVLGQLRQAQGELYPFIFLQSWVQLGQAGQNALIYIGQTVVDTVSWDELAELGLAPTRAEVVGAIGQLVKLSLVEVSETSGQFRYGLHALTRTFVNEDLPRWWREQGLL